MRKIFLVSFLSVTMCVGIISCSEETTTLVADKKTNENLNSLIGSWGLNCTKKEEEVEKQFAENPQLSLDYPNYLDELKEQNSLVTFRVTETKLIFHGPEVIYISPEDRDYAEDSKNLEVKLMREYPYSIRKEIGDSFFEIEYLEYDHSFPAAITVDGNSLKITKGSNLVFPWRKGCTWRRK